ncbi:hypothetical protein Pmani_033224 [Petrolisthes manimaculis]|uniref:Uncharacterized protein n=1 Tax=Petrolisthes manimaculis TaxID=1843537 RepID=A0AAE1NQ21_9EUCA|nr:hypothetical protein Pmani_033224 [Petrolisthes manimaculis]
MLNHTLITPITAYSYLNNKGEPADPRTWDGGSVRKPITEHLLALPTLSLSSPTTLYCTATATPQSLKTLPLFPLTIRGFTSQQLLYDITLRPAQTDRAQEDYT